jgi:uncharacterized membrane protein YfcA
MEIIGYALGILIGLSLGLIGSGGSILAIPILVYIMHIAPSMATTYSLFIVGATALIGSFKGAKDKLLDFNSALFFGIPSLVAIFIMRKFLVPLLPNNLFTISNFMVSKDLFIMLVFAVLMIIASLSMIRKKTNIAITENNKFDKLGMAWKGIVVGVLTGFVGVGGGFLIIPTLIFSAKLPMKKAVATSLIVISINAIIGFLGSIGNTAINWNFLITFTIFAVVGIFIGRYFSQKISNEKLKPAFGWFVFITGLYIIIKELWF